MPRSAVAANPEFPGKFGRNTALACQPTSNIDHWLAGEADHLIGDYRTDGSKDRMTGHWSAFDAEMPGVAGQLPAPIRGHSL
jgi:hypothetical protein